MFWSRQNYPVWREMDRLLREMNDVFYPTQASGRSLQRVDFPPVNMWSDEEKVILSAEMPGIDLDDLAINVIDDTISIQGKRQGPAKGEKNNGFTYHRQERRIGNFRRLFQLPYKIEADKVDARYEKGILTVTLPRSEKDKPKKISVAVS